MPSAQASGVRPEGPRAFLCPRCGELLLAPVNEPVAVARCRACAFTVEDLLGLVPVEPLSTAEALFGSGRQGILRLAVFAAATGLMLYLLASTA